MAQQQRLRSLDVNALTLLVGQPLSADLLDTRDAGDAPFGSVPAGLPSDLLARRADIRQAEQLLVANNVTVICTGGGGLDWEADGAESSVLGRERQRLERLQEDKDRKSVV